MKNKNRYSEKKTRKNAHAVMRQSYTTHNKQALAIYGSNFLGSFVPNLGGYFKHYLPKGFNKDLFNPVGAVVFGSLNIAKKLSDKVDNSYVRLFELGGAVYYTSSAVSNFLSVLDGKVERLGAGFMDGLMAYQLLKNEGVLNNLMTGRTKEDLKKVIACSTKAKANLESRLDSEKNNNDKDDYWYYK